MESSYHKGEIAVQTRVGVADIAEETAADAIRAHIPSGAHGFLARQPFAVVASVDAAGRVWTSLVAGAPGFLEVAGRDRLAIRALPAAGDSLVENLRANDRIGVLVIEPASRRRLRLNGRAQLVGDAVELVTEQVYPNCPKYIQARTWEMGDARTPTARRLDRLDDDAQWLVAQSDTFFVGSFAEGGADASHRGGNAGFVRVVDDRTILWPDYVGNNFFQTLGNLTVNPRAGLLFVDWETGDTLQLAGEARILWDAEAAEISATERAVEFTVHEGIYVAGASPLTWTFVGYFPFNPL